jgi:hypothetical protein
MAAMDASLRVTFSTQAESSRIVGRLHDEQGAEHSFSSWLGLLSLLQAASERAGSSPASTVAAR